MKEAVEHRGLEDGLETDLRAKPGPTAYNYVLLDSLPTPWASISSTVEPDDNKWYLLDRGLVRMKSE